MPSPVKWRGAPVLRRLSAEGPVRGAEIGVFKGKLSSYLLAKRPDLTLIMVDPWRVPDPKSDYARSEDGYGRRMSRRKDAEDIYRIAMQVTEFAADRRIVMRETSEEAAKKIEAKSLDFVFIDGDHSFHQVRWDLYWWFCKIKADGWLSGHDRARPGVSRALEAFAAESGLSVEQDTGGTWHIKMTTPMPLGFKTRHDGDCTIYASLINHTPEAGICTCRYGLEQVRRTSSDAKLYSQERRP